MEAVGEKVALVTGASAGVGAYGSFLELDPEQLDERGVVGMSLLVSGTGRPMSTARKG